MGITNNTITFWSLFEDHLIDTGQGKIQFRNHLYTTADDFEIEILSQNSRVKVQSSESLSNPIVDKIVDETPVIKRQSKGGKNEK
jgi:hypothetical protein